MSEHYDFAGYVTKNDLRCSDGRIIRKNAFADDDGQIVPLVFNHQHNSPENVLGHCLLKNDGNGVRGYGTFNDTEMGAHCRELVKNGDMTKLSIYANNLKQQGAEVLHGAIREVSLVLAGANPGAYIDSVMIHGEYSDEDAVIYSDEDIELYHADQEDEEDEDSEDGETVQDILDTMDDRQLEVVNIIVGKLLELIEQQNNSEGEMAMSSLAHSDDAIEEFVKSLDPDEVDELMDKSDEELLEIINAGKDYVDEDYEEDYDDEDDDDEDEDYYEDDDEDDYYEEDDEEGDDDMSHNIFESQERDDVLMHSEGLDVIIGDAKRCGSLKESFLQHSQDYGIEQIDWLFPEAKNVDGEPTFIKNTPDAWVSKVMSGVRKSPLSRIKSLYADIREDEARAKGYLKGTLKKEEVFGLLKRTTSPTTIYKKQKLDKDDLIDITDFNVVSWLKGEMRMMLDAELARAFLFGDGRESSNPDKIKEDAIRPIYNDEALFTIQHTITKASGESDAHAFITACVKSQKEYRGSGNLTMFVGTDMITDCLLFEDAQGHRLYKNMSELALACKVSEIVEVPDAIIPSGVVALLVNLKDYTVGADKGGSINMFEDFDIDYNQEKYLIETRCSASLTKPYSAIALKAATTSGDSING